MSKQFWAVIVVIALAFVGIAMFTGNKEEKKNGSTAQATNHVQGKGTSGVTLTEFGDYQCPYCQTYHATIKNVLATYGDQITFQFVNFPLTSLHQNAFAALRAAEAADKQGKFWEMHDALYESSDPNGRSGWVASSAPSTFFNQYAQQLGLNVEKFKTDYASKAVNSAINADLTKGNKLGVEGTPTFFLNGKKVTISNTEADFKKVLDAAIAKQGAGASSSGQTQQSTGETQTQAN